MNAGEFREAIAKQCGMEAGETPWAQWYEEQAAYYKRLVPDPYEHSLFSKAANEAFEHAPIKKTEAGEQL